MSASGGTKAVVAALLANTGIAITKFVAFFLTGARSMLAEAIHSVADAGNQGLLLLGGKRVPARGHRGAPVRLRPRALHLRVHRRHRAVQRRRAVRAVRGLPQVPRDHGRPPERASRAGGGGCRSWCWASRSCWRPSRSAPRSSRPTRSAGDASYVAVHPARQGARAAGDPARGPGRAAGPGLRLRGACRSSLITEKRVLRRRRHRA